MKCKQEVNSYANAPILNNKMQFALRYPVEPTSIIYSLDDITLKNPNSKLFTLHYPAYIHYLKCKKSENESSYISFFFFNERLRKSRFMFSDLLPAPWSPYL